MVDVVKTGPLGNPRGPRLDRVVLDLDGSTARPADDVVVVVGRTATAIERFAVCIADRVHLA